MKSCVFRRIRIVFVVSGILLLYSCVPESIFQDVLGYNAACPVFLDCTALSAQKIAFRFSKEVTVLSVNFNPPAVPDSIQNGSTVVISVADAFNAGEKIHADMLVEDEMGNTLSVFIPLRARNDRIPQIQLTEIRTEYSKPKCEYIEFKCTSAGELGALRLYISDYGFEQPFYEFPRAEVRENEYVVFHLRTLDPLSVNECGDDLAESCGTDASPLGRDFWYPGSSKHIRKSDAIALCDQDGRVIDAVLLSENAEEDWTKPELREAAGFLSVHDAWRNISGDGSFLRPPDACISGAMTPTRTLNRNESIPDSGTALDWYVCTTGGASPGLPNSTEPYSEP